MSTIVISKRDPKPPDKEVVYIGRPTIFGNVHNIGKCKWCHIAHDRADAIRHYRDYFEWQIHFNPEFHQAIETLRGKALQCFCKPEACHGDVIAEWLNDPANDPAIDNS